MLLDICRRIYAYTYIYSCTSALENIYQCKFYIDLDFDEENVQVYSIYVIEDLYVHVGCVWLLLYGGSHCFFVLVFVWFYLQCIQKIATVILIFDREYVVLCSCNLYRCV